MSIFREILKRCRSVKASITGSKKKTKKEGTKEEVVKLRNIESQAAQQKEDERKKQREAKEKAAEEKMKNSMLKREPTAEEKVESAQRVRALRSEVAKNSKNPDAINEVQKWDDKRLEKEIAEEKKANESEAGLKELSEHYDNVVNFFKNGGFHRFKSVMVNKCIIYICDILYKDLQGFVEAVEKDVEKNDANAPSRECLLSIVSNISELNSSVIQKVKNGGIEDENITNEVIEKCEKIKDAFGKVSTFSVEGAFLSNGFVKYQMKIQTNILSGSIDHIKDTCDIIKKKRDEINANAADTQEKIKRFLIDSENVKFKILDIYKEPDLLEFKEIEDRDKIVNVCQAYNLEVKAVIVEFKRLFEEIVLKSYYKNTRSIDPIDTLVRRCDTIIKYIEMCEKGKVRNEDLSYTYKGEERPGYDYPDSMYSIINSYEKFRFLQEALLDVIKFFKEDDYENSFLYNKEVQKYIKEQNANLGKLIKNLSILKDRCGKCKMFQLEES